MTQDDWYEFLCALQQSAWHRDNATVHINEELFDKLIEYATMMTERRW